MEELIQREGESSRRRMELVTNLQTVIITQHVKTSGVMRTDLVLDAQNQVTQTHPRRSDRSSTEPAQHINPTGFSLLPAASRCVVERLLLKTRMQVEELSAVRQALQADLETSIRRIVDLQAALEGWRSPVTRATLRGEIRAEETRGN
ncbi:hypothetical protein INR49_005472 [Caranx melampygus]|nr:hypothetical protein INR49_005472 [Caranx melampygus]